MKKYICLILVINALLLSSCEVRFESDVRIITKGTVVNDLNEPVNGAEISVYTIRSSGGYINTSGPVGNRDYLLGQGFSTENGDFEVVSLFDRDDDFSVLVSGNENNSIYEYARSTANFVPEELILDLESITITRTGIVNYNITNTDGDANTFQFSFSFIDPYCFEFYDEEGLNTNLSYCFEEQVFGRNLNSTTPNSNGFFETPFGTVVEFTYSLNEQDSITETFILNQDNYEFTFNY